MAILIFFCSKLFFASSLFKFMGYQLVTTYQGKYEILIKSGGWGYRIMRHNTVHRGAFCQFPFWWIYYYSSNKSTRKETGKTHLCARADVMPFKWKVKLDEMNFELNSLVNIIDRTLSTEATRRHNVAKSHTKSHF